MDQYSVFLLEIEEQKARDDREAWVEHEGRPYYDGQADGALGFDPQQPEDGFYWRGYSKGLRDFWLAKLARTVTLDLENF